MNHGAWWNQGRWRSRKTKHLLWVQFYWVEMLLLLERNGLFFHAIFFSSNPFLCLISVLHGMYVLNVHLPFSIKDHAETKPMKSIVADICDTESIEDVFDNVDVVFHCAALINFQFPPNVSELERVNVDGKFFLIFFRTFITRNSKIYCTNCTYRVWFNDEKVCVKSTIA